MWFFFFVQKTAYELLRSLVGSERCIRDRVLVVDAALTPLPAERQLEEPHPLGEPFGLACLLYTSDAADDLLRVVLGGCRIIKKKTHPLFLLYTSTASTYLYF